MTNKLHISAIAAAVVMAISSIGATGQMTGGGSSAAALKGQFALLPASDGVAFVDSRSLLRDVLPSALARNPAKLAEINAEMDRFKARTGIDFRSLDIITAGTQFVQIRPGTTKVETVVLARGSFDSAAIVATGKMLPQGQYREESYKGMKISIFSINDRLGIMGILNVRFRDIAAVVTSPGTLAMGDLSRVHALIDTVLNSRRGVRPVVDNELVRLATRDPNAIVGFASNVPPGVMQNVNFGDEEVSRNIASIRQAYGTLTGTSTGFKLITAVKTEKADQAAGLKDAIAGFRQIAGFALFRIPSGKRRVAQTALENLKVATSGNELQISIELSKEDVADGLAVSSGPK